MPKTQIAQSSTILEVDAELCSLVLRFRDVLELRPEVVRCFAEHGVQVEGWLKGEILAFLTEEKHAGRIVDFDREVLIGVGRRKVDLTLYIQQGGERRQIWIELKHYLIGWQKGIEYNAFGYFNDPAAGIKPDVEKLLAISSCYRYVLILATARPDLVDWEAAITRFNVKFQPCLRSLTDPSDFPVGFFLGLVSVAKHAHQDVAQ